MPFKCPFLISWRFREHLLLISWVLGDGAGGRKGSCVAASWGKAALSFGWPSTTTLLLHCLGDALCLILWTESALSRPPAQPLVLLCAANLTPSGRSAWLMPPKQRSPGDPWPHLCSQQGLVNVATPLQPHLEVTLSAPCRREVAEREAEVSGLHSQERNAAVDSSPTGHGEKADTS